MKPILADEKQFYVYVLVSKSRGSERFYIGMSTDVQKRLKEHNMGYTFSTKGYRPWDLFFYEEYTDRQEARNREKYLKSGRGRAYIRLKWVESSAAYPPV